MARVLIVEDSAETLGMLRMFFEQRTPHEVLLAKSGQEGLDKAFHDRPDVAIVDVMMPMMDGYEVVRRLRTDPRTTGMGILILTARGQAVDQRAALEAGADIYLAKPVDLLVLSDAVDQLLGKSRPEEGAHYLPRVVLPVLSLRGGVGVTTIAVNLALLLQQIAPTVLWDLSSTSGHVALHLGLQPEPHWGRYFEDPQLDVIALVQGHPSGLRALCAPPIPLVSETLNASQTNAVLQHLLTDAAFVVVDMPSTLSGSVHPVLTAARTILLVTADDPPSVQTTLATLQALQSQHVPLQRKVKVVYNIASPGRHLSARTLQRAIRVPLEPPLPYDDAQRAALSKGTPLVQG
ncbi:MAG: response regulator, partial [Anaerolineae bacterium]